MEIVLVKKVAETMAAALEDRDRRARGAPAPGPAAAGAADQRINPDFVLHAAVMPAPQLHLTFGMMVKDQPGIRPALRNACATEPIYTRLGAIFHDLPYYGNMLAEAVRYGLGSPALDEPWAYRMHSVKPERFVASFVRAAATTPGPLSRDERLALMAGLLSHCALDLTLHPLVNYCARRDTQLHGGHESVHHRLTEKYHALFFHLDRVGRDPIGTPEFRQYTQIVKQGSLLRARVEAPIVDFMRDAYRGAYGDAPDGDDLVRLGAQLSPLRPAWWRCPSPSATPS